MSKVTKQLNQIQADAHALFVAFHAYHWNIKGLQFAPIHSYTEEAYDEFGVLFDDAAERVLQIGGKPVIKAEELIKLASAPIDLKDDYSAEEVLKNVKKAYEYLLKEFKKLAEIADEAGDIVTSNFAQDKLGGYEKRLWMLDAMLAK
ncbi:MAG: DNA starvation/stationary phase protection protein [Campylobacter sp.]|nr:DNA starvation/stationary phase protection protein [Campylobacter sp.]